MTITTLLEPGRSSSTLRYMTEDCTTSEASQTLRVGFDHEMALETSSQTLFRCLPLLKRAGGPPANVASAHGVRGRS